MAKACPNCQLTYERMPGYWLGAMILNFAFTAGAILIEITLHAALTWPDPPWTAIWIAAMALGAITPFFVFPWTRTLFSAMELAVRPPELGELCDTGS